MTQEQTTTNLTDLPTTVSCGDVPVYTNPNWEINTPVEADIKIPGIVMPSGGFINYDPSTVTSISSSYPNYPQELTWSESSHKNEFWIGGSKNREYIASKAPIVCDLDYETQVALVGPPDFEMDKATPFQKLQWKIKVQVAYGYLYADMFLAASENPRIKELISCKQIEELIRKSEQEVKAETVTNTNG